jgi:hypothetical protein
LQWLDDAVASYAAQFTAATLIPARNVHDSDVDRARACWNQHRESLEVIRYPPRYWFDDAVGGPIGFPKLELSAEEQKSEVSLDGKLLRVDPLLPEFDEVPSAAVAKCANVVSLSSYHSESEVATVFPREMPNLPELIKSNTRTRVTSGGIVTLPSWSGDLALWELPSGLEVFRLWARERGVDVRLSAAGRIAKEVLRALGGPIGSALIVHEEVIRRFDKLARATSEIAVDDFRGLLRRVTPNAKSVERRLESFADRVFKLGVKRVCPTCQHANWIAVSDIGEQLDCTRCLRKFAFSRTEIPSKNDWCYRLHGPFSVHGFAQGSYCVALGLRYFAVHMHQRDAMTWWPSVELHSDRRVEEVDFGLWYRDGGPFPGEPWLVLAECKTFDKFRRGDIQRARSLAKRFPGAVLVFATLRKRLDPDEQRVLRPLARSGRRLRHDQRPQNPVLLLTGNELLGYAGRTFSTMRGGRTLAHYAVASQVDYLGLDPE